MSQSYVFNPYRLPDSAFNEGEREGLVALSGFPEWAQVINLGLRSTFSAGLYEVVPGVTSQDYATLQISGSRFGAPFTREFSLLSGRLVQLNAVGLSTIKVSVLQSRAPSGLLWGSASSERPDSRQTSDAWLYRSYTAFNPQAQGVNLIYSVPDGALGVVPLSSDPGFAWRFPRPDSATPASVVKGTTAGEEEVIAGPLFHLGFDQALAWRISL